MTAMSSKPACKYGQKCYRKNPDHLKNYSHPKKSDVEEVEEENDSSQTIISKAEPAKEGEKYEDNKRGLKQKASYEDLDEDKCKKLKTEDSLASTSDNTEQKKENPRIESDKRKKPCDEEISPSSPKDVKENIKSKFLVEMPEDFYHFWDLCRSLKPADPQDALKCLKLHLVGPYDILSGKHKKIQKNKHGRRPNFLLHYRFYYDPPEFQTVLVSKGDDSFHIGYFRDDPAEIPVFVASNSPGASSQKEKIIPCGENLFAAVHIHASRMVKSGTPFEKAAIQKLMKAVEEVSSKHDYNLSASTKRMKERQKKVVCPSFHGAGIVVPVDENEIGYRPVPETPGDLKTMFRRISEAKSDADQDRLMEPLQELITLVQFANDECDYGEGLELGLDLFSFGGSVFHPQISILLPLAYQLLNRNEFSSIITAHLDRRKPVDESVDELAV